MDELRRNIIEKVLSRISIVVSYSDDMAQLDGFKHDRLMSHVEYGDGCDVSMHLAADAEKNAEYAIETKKHSYACVVSLAPPEPNEQGLLPCGCGGKVELVEDSERVLYLAQCGTCGHKTEFWHKKQIAIDAWNRAMSKNNIVYERRREE